MNLRNGLRKILNSPSVLTNTTYLFDDKFIMILNGSEKPIEIDDVLIDEVNDYFGGLNQAKSD